MDNITSKMSHLLAIFIKPTVTSVNILYVLYEFIGVTLDIENLHTKQRKAFFERWFKSIHLYNEAEIFLYSNLISSSAFA